MQTGWGQKNIKRKQGLLFETTNWYNTDKGMATLMNCSLGLQLLFESTNIYIYIYSTD